jgi:large subunit ribosomal protein L9
VKVILLQEVPGLGQPGDVKEVANGYARNYLLPRELVTAATPAALKSLQERVAATRRRTEAQAAEHRGLADRLAAVTLTFAVHVGRGDRLYGSVTSQNIADALQEQEGLRIDRRTVHLPEPLRQLGTFEVPVRVASKLEPKVKVAIVAGDAVSGTAAVPVADAAAAEAAGAAPAATEPAVSEAPAAPAEAEVDEEAPAG